MSDELATWQVAGEGAQGGDVVLGKTIGRYLLLGRLGEGGMGVVYGAYDPDLDRKIAIKVLRPTLSNASGDSRQRFVREAQAMARLSHPNVVPVHDVGLDGDDVFIAMEFVDGVTLREWLREEELGHSDILAVFCEAGKGLAAAHKEGIVHRDFKPDNVMVGPNARPQVTDFGLACAPSLIRDPSSEAARPMARGTLPAPSGGQALAETITRMGDVMGTPAYMAPEQMHGLRSDERADQFSFCVAAYEALYGHRPYCGEDLSELVDAVLAGEVRPAPSKSRVPRSVRSALLRGLRTESAERFPSMDALLSALEGGGGRRRWQAMGAALGVLALGSATVYATRPAATEPCEGPNKDVEAVWGDSQRAAVRAAFATINRPYASASADAVIAAMDRYTIDWGDMKKQSCLATEVEGQQSEALLDLRSACLRRRLTEMESLVAVWTSPDEEVVRLAPETTHALTDLWICEDYDALTAPVAPPATPIKRQAVEALWQRMARVRAEEAAGHAPAVLDEARDITVQAEALDYAPVEAEAYALLGKVQESTSDFDSAANNLELASLRALRGKDDRTLVMSWMDLAYVEGVRRADPDIADGRLRQVGAVLDRIGNPPELQATYLENQSLLLAERGHFDAARETAAQALELATQHWGATSISAANAALRLASYQRKSGDFKSAIDQANRGLATLEAEYGPDHPTVALALQTLGNAMYASGKYKEAVSTLRRAVVIQSAAYGEDHMSMVRLLSSFGDALVAAGAVEDALQVHTRSLKLAERLNGPDHPEVAAALVELGASHVAMGNHQAALDVNLRALAIWTSTYGPSHDSAMRTTGNVGMALKKLGRFDEARTYYEASLAALIQVHGEESLNVGIVRNNLGELMRTAGEPKAALPYYRKSKSILEASLGIDHPIVAHPLTGLGRAHLLLGDAERARPLLEQALALREVGGQPQELAETRFALAQARWASPSLRQAAIALARLSLAGYEPLGDGYAVQSSRVRDWLLRHQAQGSRR